jgi:hypothetical protein
MRGRNYSFGRLSCWARRSESVVVSKAHAAARVASTDRLSDNA